MLNEILILLEREGVLQAWGAERTRSLVREIVRVAKFHDCNAGEILEEIGERMGLCYSCLKEDTIFRDGLCTACVAEFKARWG